MHSQEMSWLSPGSLVQLLFGLCSTLEYKLFVCLLLQGLLALGDYMNVQCHACIGGTNVGEDIRKLDYGQHVVAGTPGRVFGEKINFIKENQRICLNVLSRCL